MEDIHKPDVHGWISKPVDFQEMLNEAATSPLDQCFGENSLEQVMKAHLPNIDFDFKEIEKRCSLDNYYSPLEEEIELGRRFEIPPDVDLETLKCQKIHSDFKLADPEYRVFCQGQKGKSLTFSKPLGINNLTSEDSSGDNIKLPEIILRVQIYRPKRKDRPHHSEDFKVDQEFLVYGQQYLSELRDQIICISDQAVIGEFSEKPDVKFPDVCFKELYKSGFFYIGDTFYNDFRTPSCKDYSGPIIKWFKKTKSSLGPFKSVCMEQSKFIDLNIRLGYPYLYCHQGYCEHLLVFNDARLMLKDDCLISEKYPLILKTHRKIVSLCKVCDLNVAKWVVTKTKRFPMPTYVFCDRCFKDFNYTKDGKKIGDFEARKFIDRGTIV